MHETLQKYYYNEGEKQRLAELRNIQDRIANVKRTPSKREVERRNRRMRNVRTFNGGAVVIQEVGLSRQERRKKLRDLRTRQQQLKNMKGEYPTRLYLDELTAGVAGRLMISLRVVEIIDERNMVVMFLLDKNQNEGEIWLTGFPTTKLFDGEKLPPLESPVAITGRRKDHLGDLLMVVTPFTPEPQETKADKTLVP
ncbi:MAG: hypothetical protein IID41_15955 [Planctomycetes bacterium]|nr:hypothetical protein [Planctomycetota bacterium]